MPVIIEKLKQDICDIGKRVYAKGFAAANEDNISIRVDSITVQTPTLNSVPLRLTQVLPPLRIHRRRLIQSLWNPLRPTN